MAGVLGGELEAADVVVVGGGLAGWVAAVRAQQSGARVTLLEKSRRWPGWGNSMISGGALHAVLRSPYLPPSELVEAASGITDGWADPTVLEAWSRNAAPAISWLAENGADIITDGSAPHRAAVFSPVRKTEPGLRYIETGVPLFLSTIAEQFVSDGGTFLQPVRALELDRADLSRWRVTVDSAGRSTTVDSCAVVLADGGFQANRRLVKQQLGVDRYRLRGAGTATGDALKMGTAVGASLVRSTGFYGHLLAQDATHNPRLWPYPILDQLAAVGIVVDDSGTRFADETVSGVSITNEVGRSPSAQTWVIFDQGAWQSEGREGGTAPNPYLLEHSDSVVRADSIESLARAIDVDEAALLSTVAQVRDTPHSARPIRSAPVSLSEPPYYAVAVIVGMTFAFAGLRADGSGRVVDGGGEPIPGLYAAGGTMGGLHGGPQDGYTGGLLEAAVFGFIAGHSAGTWSQST